MKTSTVRKVALGLLAGGTLLGTSCLWGGDSWWSRLMWTGAVYTGLEYVTDNDAVFDLFEDGNVEPAG